MARKISLKEAKRKLQREEEIKNLIKQGKYTSKRKLRLQKRQEKEVRLIDYIKFRGGLKKQKGEEKNV